MNSSSNIGCIGEGRQCLTRGEGLRAGRDRAAVGAAPPRRQKTQAASPAGRGSTGA